MNASDTILVTDVAVNITVVRLEVKGLAAETVFRTRRHLLVRIRNHSHVPGVHVKTDHHDKSLYHIVVTVPLFVQTAPMFQNISFISTPFLSFNFKIPGFKGRKTFRPRGPGLVLGGGMTGGGGGVRGGGVEGVVLT